MSHAKFERNLSNIYEDCASYEDLILKNRIQHIEQLFVTEKDFRYLVPMMLMKDFSYPHLIKSGIQNLDLTNIITEIYKRVRDVAVSVKASVIRSTDVFGYKKTKTPKINVCDFDPKYHQLLFEALKPINSYKLNSDFFYESCPRFRLSGPLYDNVKIKLQEQSAKKGWSSLDILDRKLKSDKCCIEYYIFTGTFPIEGHLIKEHTIKRGMYLKSDVKSLKAALQTQNLQLLGSNLASYPNLPKTIKSHYRAFVTLNYEQIHKFTKRTDLKYLSSWRLGNY